MSPPGLAWSPGPLEAWTPISPLKVGSRTLQKAWPVADSQSKVAGRSLPGCLLWSCRISWIKKSSHPKRIRDLQGRHPNHANLSTLKGWQARKQSPGLQLQHLWINQCNQQLSPDLQKEIEGVPTAARWVKDLALLWLWCRPATATRIRPLGRELPYATGVAI